MPARSERRILAVGGSRAVALPPDWLEAVDLKTGDTVDVIYDSVVLVKPQGFRIDEGFLRKEFVQLRKMEQEKLRRERSV